MALQDFSDASALSLQVTGHDVWPTAEASSSKSHKLPNGNNPKLRYMKPYWWPYQTYCKQRWIGRQLLEVVSTEFRDRSVEYYRHALQSGVTRVNGQTAYPELVLRNGDRIDNTTHRHEPPIANQPILILYQDKQRGFIVISKPGSMPVHAAGRYFRHTVLEILQSDFGIKAYSVNRLDRLTSGLMILALSGKTASILSKEFEEGRVKKEYVARVKGRFPEEELTVDQPLMTVDRQMGLVIVTPDGKEAKTIFTRMSYDSSRDQSVVHCRPITGRTHQIRVHLQYLGHPIVNDPLYSLPTIWGSSLGRGGVELVPQPAESSRTAALAARVQAATTSTTPPALPDDSGRLVDREYDDIDVVSPIRLSKQARDVIAKLRRMKDEQEDWVKWKEVVFTIRKAQDAMETTISPNGHPKPIPTRSRAPPPEALPSDTPSPLGPPAYLPPGFCPECYVPLPDDPDPETLFIYLHALRYSTDSLGTWETPLPRWAGEDWDGEWRGWVEGADLPEVCVLPLGADATPVKSYA
ncbi:hypothetical protein TREMEDRAFT_25081 [Tremella mesenterica DSM 1558]|uniref:uncharacterized protein n=1 Tax=Tremella mesenterica (strain ATCC 24925 / CBS 8224 / DSM 1558 / NBRC 9311 / NRRL Y-6157 / RJB 2259-6 / UBC 559-6) TaxID=578456 RepID=UPI0003F4A635|nr:uncharacterized protein TREMEDRAFT_25081 [Tremella mesenterica DSM 1558]EIW73598.1 hypothetical protein TREMEDRAFT_25081 [Tremella mesenterica DSM 1558]